MKTREYFYNLGYTLEELFTLVETGKLINSNEELIINDGDFFLECIRRANLFNIDIYPLFHLEPYYNKIIDVFNRYIKLEKYSIAKDILDAIIILSKKDNLKNLSSHLEIFNDDIKYIVTTTDIDNEIIVDGLKKLERRALINLEISNFNEGKEIIKNLNYIYEPHLDSKPFLIAELFFIKHEKLLKRHTEVASPFNIELEGEEEVVLMNLLRRNDFYRVNELILKHIDDNIFDIKWEIFKVLNNRIIKLNNKNMEMVLKHINLNSNGVNREVEILNKGHLTNIKLDLISTIDESLFYLMDNKLKNEINSINENNKDINKKVILLMELLDKYKEINDNEAVERILNYIESLIDTTEIDYDNRKEFTLSLKNYRII